MTLLTDVDIKKALGKDIVIEPCIESNLTPIGYDFTIGDFVFSLEKGLLEPKEGVYILPPKNTFQILTKESLWVSNRIGGTFHSKVSLVSKGLSHISTTLDPGWYGPLLITIRNNTDNEIPIKTTDTFVTLIFFKVLTPTKTRHWKPEFRKDILTNQLDNQTGEYIKKIKSILGNPRVLEKFERQVKEANKHMISKILASPRSKKWREELSNIGTLIIYICIFGIIVLPFYGDKIKLVLNNIGYDPSIFSVQLVAIIVLISLHISLKKK